MKLKTLVYLTLIALVGLLNPAAHAQTFSVIFTFDTPDNRWASTYPTAGVTIKDGNLYGTTSGQAGGVGAVYELQPVGNEWNAIPIYLPSHGGDTPYARVVVGPDGNFYGTTSIYFDAGGSVFQLVPPNGCERQYCNWTQNVLQAYTHYDGGNLGYGDLLFDQNGDIYGTTLYTVFKLTHSGDTWTQTVLHTFSGIDGELAWSDVIFGKDGNLYGTTQTGGHWTSAAYAAAGTVFQLKNKNGTWTETVLYSFLDGGGGSPVNGIYPVAGLVSDSSGNLYGATSQNGANGGGTVFELSPSGDTWTFKLLYNFGGGGQCGPWANMTMDAAGNLYGTTYCDGPHGYGTVFKLTNNGNSWVYTSLHDFTGGPDGGNPISNVTFDENGNLYGTTSYGGTGGAGVVWMIKP